MSAVEPSGFYYLDETDQVIAQVGWRWSRWRAERLARRLEETAFVTPRTTGLVFGYRTHRYVVERAGVGRWRVLAKQNVLRHEQIERRGGTTS